MRTELEQLKARVAEIERLQRECDHEWDEPYETTMNEPIHEMKFHGVDCFPEVVGYKKIKCWARICKKCEKKEITKETEIVPVQTVIRPKFK